MANLIDVTYFCDSLNIPNHIGTQAVNLAIDASIDKKIAIKETEYLTNLLGATLYAELLAGLSVVPTPLAKWTDLKNMLLNSTLKISPIANYVFFYYAKDKLKLQVSDENPVMFSAQTMVDAWNVMVDKNVKIYDFLIENSTIYTSFLPDLNDDEFINLFVHVNIYGI